MLNICRYVKSVNKYLLINSRYLSISKSDLVESSQNIQEILKTTKNNESSTFSIWLYNSLNKIHSEYPSTQIATSTKEIYQLNSSKFNSKFIQLEDDRKKQSGDFKENNINEQLIILLRYIRYLEISFIYRFITYDIDIALKEILNSIINLTKDQNNLNKNSLSLISELTFFVYSLSSYNSLSNVKSLLSSTSIVNYLTNSLYSIILSDDQSSSLLLVNQLCLALHSIIEIPTSSSSIDLWSSNLLKYLYKQRSCSLSIIKYLILIQHSSPNQNSTEILSLLNEYLIEIGIHQENFNSICQLLILISSYNYSHELFQREICEKIQNYLKKSNDKGRVLSDVKLCSRLIYYLCLNDPTNRFESRSTIVELSRKLNDNIEKEKIFPQWIVQAQHGMMLSNIYNYRLLFATLQHKFFPLLFRDLGVYTKSIQRQLFDIHYALSIDRPSFDTPLLNSEMLSFAKKISDQYRTSIRTQQKTYNRFLTDLKQEFNQIYGENTCKIINTDENYPYILFDFLEVNLPDTDQLRVIGINTKQRIAILPILNSMLIRQQRSDGSSIRIFSAHTSMRYRLIEKANYQVLPIFHGEYLRAVRNNTIQTLFETNLALKTIPHQSELDKEDSIDL
ncbi:unnamed protein product [Adineta steineri]|uniref:Uncharacterized protein n=1 Tax=Adineta steineri TaxID=433720 RepID=A0A819EN62_9BILA|nr:unnamed protein product [Adineta steineri]CAF3854865.1 unnamed protein product [Adineta steineri]